ncbi:dTDP-4-dehydrorhamnose 3,5-epimerase [Entomospira nematocerorum]|uniref:dTDP-4-dehydrorhamnose 3,5-epimerase n=1 Tax=Entomospira nematocerorum TaxID=2719987 RepID=A0A968GF93_9SPIO|nr:dTDP-4-dehydrorhamnose 3,5-epimerase [Entomospira nematocera]NIZ47143.1 dTDP-4-dehydrorhamnose 3,5-epimerase [Entomospira nematocera]WDI34314.1 dTDP-4-dehydrorhamnose 3,5-epimerase [Entomospira nematocera]
MHVRHLQGGLIVIEPQLHEDRRGLFFEQYKESLLIDIGVTDRLVQSNVSISHKGVFRGLHYQRGAYAQGKLISCLHGAIWDVVIDIRPDSPHYLQWYSFYLTSGYRRQLWIPPGFLHGFYALMDNTHVVYHMTREYNPSCDVSVFYQSTAWMIPWPAQMLLSDKDRDAPHWFSS